MIFKKNNRGQAAIEFLMTYGWMLLVVLIVGALIFSFVDFGALLPNKIDLSNNVRASATDSLAYSQDTANADAANEVWIVFTYTGAKQAEIKAYDNTITTNLGGVCQSYNVTNLDTGASAGELTTDGTEDDEEANNPGMSFLNSQTGIIRFVCDNTDMSKIDSATNLIKGDVVEGELIIKVTNPKTNLAVPSSGPIRLTIGQ